MMNNPEMMAMAQAMMQDPEVMSMMQQPGMMEKLQAAMQNPALAMSDPDVAKIAMKLSGMGMGGGGGGMGGGMGGMGGMGMGGGGSGSTPSGPAPNIVHLHSASDLTSLLARGGSTKLVVIDYFTTWCGPCKAIAPLFNELAHAHKEKVLFAKVDGDRARDLCEQEGITGFPTFHFYLGGKKIESFSGADRQKLQRIVEEHANYEPPPPPCPYKHFPLRESELVKYGDMKWEMVQPKFRELSDKFPAEDPARLTGEELTQLDKLMATLQDKSSYHTSNVTSEQFQIPHKLLTTWPKENQGPVINLLRMAVFHPMIAKYYADEMLKTSSSSASNDILPHLLKLAHSSDKSVTTMLIIRTLVNMFSRRALGKAISIQYETILESVSSIFHKFVGDENLRLSIIALYINFAIFFTEDIKYFEQAKVLLLTNIQDALQGGNGGPIDPRIAYRCIIIVGTILYRDTNATELARDLDVLETVRTAIKSEACQKDQQIQQAFGELEQAIKQ